MRRAHVRRDDIARVVSGVAFFLVFNPKCFRQIGIELARRHRRFADIALLRRLAEAAHYRRPRAMRVGEVGAAVERVIGRRLQPASLISPLPIGERVTTRSVVGKGGTAERFDTPLPAAFAIALTADLSLPRRGDRFAPARFNSGLRSNAGAAATDGGIE